MSYKKGDRVRGRENAIIPMLQGLMGTVRDFKLGEETPPWSHHVYVDWDKPNIFSHPHLSMLEPAYLLDPNKPIRAKDGREFEVMGRFTHPVEGECLIGDVNSPASIYPMFVSLRTGRYVPVSPGDGCGAGLTFTNEPIVSYRTLTEDDVTVKVTYVNGVADSAELV